jgi:uncharacterized membrane protein YkoI
MNRYATCTALTMIAVSLTMTAQERKVEENVLPAPVQKTFHEQTQGATIKGYTTEVENGKRLYEAETVVNGHTKDISVQANGALSEIEEEVAFDSLPTTVQAALTKRAAGAKITKVESLTKHGKLVAYEAATLRGTKRGEIQVGPNGDKLSHEE